MTRAELIAEARAKSHDDCMAVECIHLRALANELEAAEKEAELDHETIIELLAAKESLVAENDRLKNELMSRMSTATT